MTMSAKPETLMSDSMAHANSRERIHATGMRLC